MSQGNLEGWAGGPLPTQNCPPALCPCQLSATAEQGQPWCSGKLEWGSHRGLGLGRTPATCSSLWEPLREKRSGRCVSPVSVWRGRGPGTQGRPLCYVWGAGCLCPACDPALEGSCPVGSEGATTKVAGRW